ncbi:MraY family glycosyltransferase [Polaribacter sargassicola]|uniref:MraY family glycosyltransferase n=1 Tax=Polaribacter sargassicola TaxID=2836891 RepID=UPI001F2FADF4|nr:glycosyltransferase family 4 protein [Polaribacter sp. DS7-9]MCG1036550.1 glycosyltransferase family 4 protein [Polaribacter sp. DS7-9]
MEKYFFILVIIAILSFVYLKLAIKFKIIDKPNKRSSHTKITVRGGGIIFPIAILLFSLLNDFSYPYFTIGVVLISIVSFLDDIYTLSSKVRFPFQLLAVLLILVELALPFSPIYLYVFYILFGVGVVNMFNFMDGINGITGLYTISVLLGFYFINEIEALVAPDLIIYSLISLIVFGFYNFRKKALFFAGDIGSITLGVLVFFLLILFTYKLSSPLIFALVIVYGGDALITLLYRKIFTKESVLDAHRHHIYQKLVDVKKISHLNVSIIYALLQMVVNIIVYKSYKLDFNIQIFVFLGLMIVFFSLYLYSFKRLKTT